jgi:hypothetical protein
LSIFFKINFENITNEYIFVLKLDKKQENTLKYQNQVLYQLTEINYLFMGAGKPEIGKRTAKTPISFLQLLLVAVMLLIVVGLLQRQYFTSENEVPALSPLEEQKLDRRLREIDDSEQYALVASINGLYPCLHIGRTTCYLKPGEIWKYGVTSKGEFGRYAASFLIKNKVSYIVQFKGTFSECLKQEQIRLYNYPYLPENLMRPQMERLPRPPYNSIMR